MEKLKAHDAYNDPNARFASARDKRATFAKLKRTASFKKWRKRQLRIQDNKCAYCRERIDLGAVVEVDHVQPLIFDGTNRYDNLLLACRPCNQRKWISDRYVVPQWIKNRASRLAIKDRCHYKQRQAAIRALDEQLLDEVLFWI